MNPELNNKKNTKKMDNSSSEYSLRLDVNFLTITSTVPKMVNPPIIQKGAKNMVAI